MHKTFLSLGSNLGKRKKYLSEAIALIERRIGNLMKSSALYETEPWGFETNNKFMNMVIALDTMLDPKAVLKECLAIEQELGRKRASSGGYISRTIDIDVLFYDDLIMASEALVLPHPRIEKRRFILVPLCDVAPDFVHPVLKQTIANLENHCDDNGKVDHAGYLSTRY